MGGMLVKLASQNFNNGHIMYFDVWRKPKHIPKELIAAAIMFSYDYFDIPENISTNVFFNRKKDPYIGYALWDADEGGGEVFLYNGMSARETIVTLFHEMAHINQQMIGDLEVDIDEGTKTWIGVEYTYREGCIYDELPWEMDALKRERIMMEEFTKKADPSLLTFLSESVIVTTK